MTLSLRRTAMDFSPALAYPEGTRGHAGPTPPRGAGPVTTGLGNAMANAWMPGAQRLTGGNEHAPPGAGAPRAVWTVTGTGPGAGPGSARAEAERLVAEGRAPHLVWHPLSGETVQILAATRRSELPLGETRYYEQYVDHAEEGRVCLAVAVVAQRSAPFTDGPMLGLTAIMDWLGSWGVARRWPSGPPGAEVPDRDRLALERTARMWARGGHFGHDQVPGSRLPGPGFLDVGRLLTPETGENGLHTPHNARATAIP